MNRVEAIKTCITNGIDLQRKDVSLCDLSRMKLGIIDRKYQVYSSKFSKIYINLDEAIDKFVELIG